ncbi:hypothetical protein PR1_22A [Providencia phage vB_PreS_PR1]|uniref:Uncharacterized protein n=1 Tax=Providencia phage vB_PreS_PR1 TaxID=1931407 RepID=A0A1V0DNU3_9CAUD|nr:hypothetical protein FDH30_gp023 [Providencia phage vB_PreS_PR1]ARB02554.1 hypothetical protein PR1_22A [Providencia phage vB_PreS_PR1]
MGNNDTIVLPVFIILGAALISMPIWLPLFF